METRCIGCMLQLYMHLASSRLARHAIQPIQPIQPIQLYTLYSIQHYTASLSDRCRSTQNIRYGPGIRPKAHQAYSRWSEASNLQDGALLIASDKPTFLPAQNNADGRLLSEKALCRPRPRPRPRAGRSLRCLSLRPRLDSRAPLRATRAFLPSP